MERGDLEKCLASLRAKVIKGAKPTRGRRMRGYLSALQGGVVSSGQSQDALNPAPAVERDVEDQPVGEAEESSMGLSDAVGRFRRQVSEGKAAKKPGDPGTDKHQAKLNKAAWAKMSPAQKKKYTGDTPMPSHKAEDERIDFDRVPVESIMTEEARLMSEHDERDVAFAKSMLLDRVGLHHSVREQLGLVEEEEQPRRPAKPKPKARPKAKLAEASVSVLRGSGSKSNFRGVFPGAQVPPNDEESMEGVRGAGYGRHGRERVDVRTESKSGGMWGSVRSALEQGEFDWDERKEGFVVNDNPRTVERQLRRGGLKNLTVKSHAMGALVRIEDEDPRFVIEEERTGPDPRFSMNTGSFSGERGIAPIGRDSMDESVDADGNFDPTKLKYPKELIGR